jgi:putative addiction module component (TIGR02574 family)
LVCRFGLVCPGWFGLVGLVLGFCPGFWVFAGGLHMSATITSVFDLSPSEKLQLVEDLWDDLAATPEAVPIYDWQKEELARRKANLMQNPASGLAWEEVKRRVRNRYGR